MLLGPFFSRFEAVPQVELYLPTRLTKIRELVDWTHFLMRGVQELATDYEADDQDAAEWEAESTSQSDDDDGGEEEGVLVNAMNPSSSLKRRPPVDYGVVRQVGY